MACIKLIFIILLFSELKPPTLPLSKYFLKCLQIVSFAHDTLGVKLAMPYVCISGIISPTEFNFIHIQYNQV